MTAEKKGITPEPWERHGREIFGEGRHIATVHTPFGVWETNEAITAAIAALPELLGACEIAVKGCQGTCNDPHTSQCDCAAYFARQALAKARGE